MPRTSGFTEAELAAYEWSKNQRGKESSQNRKKIDSRRRSPSESSGSDSDHSRGHHRKSRRNERNSRRTKYGGTRDEYYRRSRSRSSEGRYKRSYRDYGRVYRDSSHSVTSSSRDSRSRSHGRYRSTSSSTPRDPYNPLKLAHRVNKRRSRDGYDDGPPKDDERWKHDLYESDGERAAHEAKFRAQKQNVGYVVDTRRGSWRSRAGGVYLSPKEQVEDDLYEDYRRKSYRSSPSYSRD